MARKIKNGCFHETIYGIETVTPPIPDPKDIAGYDLPQKQQKFRRPELPGYFRNIHRDEYGRPVWSAQQQAYIDQEEDRRLDGYWFYNNGEATYLPGGYYFELVYWHIDIGFKEYRDRDRRKWMFWRHAVNDPKCFGIIYMKHRRDGATFWAQCVLYETITRMKNSRGGMQSKTKTDAKKLFQKGTVGPWRKLVEFFKPVSDGTTNPKTQLSFFEPADKMTKKNTVIKASTALDSYIDFQPPTSSAYDGDKLQFYHGDEWGKTVEAKVSETWKVVKECLSLGNGKIIIGKAMITSTVEEMEKKGGREFEKIWEQSDPLVRSKNGSTTSGLHRLFIPAYDGLEGFIDEYGMSVIDAPTPEQLAFLRRKFPEAEYVPGIGARQHILNERQAYIDAEDSEGVASHRRLYPCTEAEAFTPPPQDSDFNTMKIDNRKDELRFRKPNWVLGNFVWENGIKHTRVKFQPTPKGRWKVSYQFPDPKDSNKKKHLKGEWYPDNTSFGVQGVDPVDHKKVKDDKRKSKFCAAIFRKLDLALESVPQNTNKFIALYNYRPKKPEIAYEDAMLACIYYGVETLPESQKPGYANYVEAQGYGGYLMVRPRYTHGATTEQKEIKEIGLPASDLVNQQIVDCWMSYIEDYCHLIDFPEMLDDLREFDMNDTKKSDITMGGGYALIGSKKHTKKKEGGVKVSDFYRVHKRRA